MANRDTFLRQAAVDYADGYGRSYDLGLCVSVHCATWEEGESWDEFKCRLATLGRVRNKQVRLALRADVEGLGFRVEPTPPPPSHRDVDLGILDPASEFDRVVGAFAAPEENPCPYLD